MHARINNRVSVREKDKGIKKEQNALRPQMTMMIYKTLTKKSKDNFSDNFLTEFY